MMVVWWVLVAGLVVGTTHSRLTHRDASTCTPTFSKVLFNQTEGSQYVQYAQHLPDMTGFTLHYWINLLEPANYACPFAYYNEADGTFIQVLVITPRSTPSFVLQVNGVIVSLVQHKVKLVGEWHHVLHSWHSGTGRWSLYVDGRLVQSETDERKRGLAVSGGGRAFSGQRHEIITGKYPCDGCGHGLHGWLTLLGFDTHGIQRANYWMTRMMVSVVADGCSPEVGGDVINWKNTPRRGYGGAMEAPANSTCGAF